MNSYKDVIEALGGKEDGFAKLVAKRILIVFLAFASDVCFSLSLLCEKLSDLFLWLSKKLYNS